jgi:hypothetical protein
MWYMLRKVKIKIVGYTYFYRSKDRVLPSLSTLNIVPMYSSQSNDHELQRQRCTSSLVHFKTETFSSTLKNALAYRL